MNVSVKIENAKQELLKDKRLLFLFHHCDASFAMATLDKVASDVAHHKIDIKHGQKLLAYVYGTYKGTPKYR